ncbi:MAG: glycosyltransferase family 4 protein, partial [Chthoniobacterales bacterium]
VRSHHRKAGMKITVVNGAFLPVPPIMGGAIEKMSLALANEFARRGHEVTSVSRAVPELPREEVRDGVKFLRVPGFDTPGWIVWLKFLDLIYSIRVLRVLPVADIIVTHTFWLPILLRKERQGKVYVHVGRYPKGQMRLYRHAARFQAMTLALARAIAREVPDCESKISIIPNPAPETRMPGRPPPLEARAQTILFVGRIHPEKGIHLLIDAFAGKPAAFEDWKLVIVGPAEKKFGGGGERYLADLKKRAEGAAISFRGPIFDPLALEDEFRSARLFVYPSLAERGETFGLAAVEAMAHGCPVVVSDLGCFHDFIRDNKTGFIFNHRAPHPALALREKMANAMASPVWLARVAEAGYHHVTAEYSLSRVADRFLDDFQLLLQNSNG